MSLSSVIDTLIHDQVFTDLSDGSGARFSCACGSASVSRSSVRQHLQTRRHSKLVQKHDLSFLKPYISLDIPVREIDRNCRSKVEHFQYYLENGLAIGNQLQILYDYKSQYNTQSGLEDIKLENDAIRIVKYDLGMMFGLNSEEPPFVHIKWDNRRGHIKTEMNIVESRRSLYEDSEDFLERGNYYDYTYAYYFPSALYNSPMQLFLNKDTEELEGNDVDILHFFYGRDGRRIPKKFVRVMQRPPIKYMGTYYTREEFDAYLQKEREKREKRQQQTDNN